MTGAAWPSIILLPAARPSAPVGKRRQPWAMPLSALLHAGALVAFLQLGFPAADPLPPAVEVTLVFPEEPAMATDPAPQSVPQTVAAEPAPVSAKPAPVQAKPVRAKALPARSVATPTPRPVDEGMAPPADAATAVTNAPEMDAGASAAPSVAGKMSADLLAAYVGRVRAMLERYKRYPSQARYNGVEGTVTLRFLLDRQGELLEWTVVAASGDASLDAEAARMLRRAAPFPELPPALERDRLELVVPVIFSLKRDGPA